MSAEATALILGLTDADQAEYAAAAHKTSAPEPEGEASTGAGQTPAADVEGASASGSQTEQLVTVPAIANTPAPRWASVDDTTADLLSLVAHDKSGPWADEEWHRFTQALEAASDLDGRIDPNFLRPLLRGSVAPNRIGAFTNRAKAEGLIAWSGEWIESDDTEGRNGGKPCRVYRWLGGGDPDAP